jgi:hypothetical protein
MFSFCSISVSDWAKGPETMDGESFQATRGYRLDTPTDRQGVSCDERGPALGPIRLLTKTAAGWQPYAPDQLNSILGEILARPVNSTALMPGLRAVARSLDEGNMVRAMIGTQLLKLPVLSEIQARRAMALKLLSKASPDCQFASNRDPISRPIMTHLSVEDGLIHVVHRRDPRP